MSAQQDLIAKIALGSSLEESLSDICLAIESLYADLTAYCSILILQNDRLLLGAAPSLPAAYSQAINGGKIGPEVGSCGTAAYTKSRVIVSDIESDPLWNEFKDLALIHGLRSCWSTPILSQNNEVLGTFAVYTSEKLAPEGYQLELIDRFTHLSGLAIEKDKSARREASLIAELQQSNDKFKALTAVIPDLAMVISDEGEYVDIYGADKSLVVASPSSLIGKKLTDILPDDSAKEVMAVIARTLESGKVEVCEYDLKVPRGECIFEGRVTRLDHYLPEAPEKRHVLWMDRDITDRKMAEQTIRDLALHDPLTQVPNRRLLNDRLQRVLGQVRRYNKFGALLYLDMDGFKKTNDVFGHSVGDVILEEVARRLKTSIREADTLARIGGDEFVVLFESLQKTPEKVASDIQHVALKLIETLNRKFRVDSEEFQLGVSIGCTVIGARDKSADDVIKRADMAMYESKAKGGNKFTICE